MTAVSCDLYTATLMPAEQSSFSFLALFSFFWAGVSFRSAFIASWSVFRLGEGSRSRGGRGGEEERRGHVLGHLVPDLSLYLGGVEDLFVAQNPHQVGHLHLGLIWGDQAQSGGRRVRMVVRG